MTIENLTDLEDKLYHKGLPKEMATELLEAVKTGQTEVALEHTVQSNEHELAFRVHFRYDSETDKAYLNSFDLAITDGPGIPQGGLVQNFPDQWFITAMESFRMLKHGEQVSVNKNLYSKEGNAYNAWLSIDNKAPKDEFGNYPVKFYHENYFKKQPDWLEYALKDLAVPVKELEDKRFIQYYEKDFKKANLISVTIMHNGEESKGYLSINPAARQVDVYNAGMVLIPRQGQEQATKQEQASGQQPGDVKKKPWPDRRADQKITWNQKDPKQNKGKSVGR